MELVSVVQELYNATKRIQASGQEVYRLGNEKAEAERNYRKELAMAIVNLRFEKVQATLISDLARGQVADLKFERDLSHDRYRSAMAATEVLKVEINALQTIAKYSSEIND